MAEESLAMKENQYRYLGIEKPTLLIAMYSTITDLMFLSSNEKYLQKSSARQ